jgi:hypothetical protein
MNWAVNEVMLARTESVLRTLADQSTPVRNWHGARLKMSPDRGRKAQMLGEFSNAGNSSRTSRIF